MRNFIGVSLISICLLAVYAAPCSHCKRDPLCVSQCAYDLLVKANSNAAIRESYLLLAHAWLWGKLYEGIPKAIEKVIQNSTSKDSLYYHALLILANFHQAQERGDSAIFWYEQVASQAKGYPWLNAFSYLSLASLYANSSLNQAAQAALQAMQILNQHPEPILIALTQNTLAYIAASQRDYTRALSLQQEAKETIDTIRTESPFLLLSPLQETRMAITANLGSLYLEIGKTAEAEALYKPLLKKAQEEKDSLTIAQAVLGLAQVALLKKKSSEALQLLESHHYLESRLTPSLLKEWNYTLAQVYLSQNRHAQAIKLYENLLEKVENSSKHVAAFRTAQWQILAGMEQQQAEISHLKESRRRERTLYGISLTLWALALIILSYTLYQNRKRSREQLKFQQIILNQSEELRQKNYQLSQMNHELAEV
ncbi:MAG: tetratricopeptide repeat protein, partial [Bacteroidia bacterium]|nr:tetratricopeptide repeat protein [Bacteroidia bacterium]MDW8135092.1 tetratricopeptide repeat protein [Bacteroidia bacterium]